MAGGALRTSEVAPARPRARRPARRRFDQGDGRARPRTLRGGSTASSLVAGAVADSAYGPDCPPGGRPAASSGAGRRARPRRRRMAGPTRAVGSRRRRTAPLDACGGVKAAPNDGLDVRGGVSAAPNGALARAGAEMAPNDARDARGGGRAARASPRRSPRRPAGTRAAPPRSSPALAVRPAGSMTSAPVHHVGDLRRHPGRDLLDPAHRGRADGQDELSEAGQVLVGPMPREGVVQADAERPDVRARVDGAAAAPARATCRAESRGRAALRHPAVAEAVVRHLGDAEVEHLDHALAALLLREEQVRRLDVAVDDAGLVRALEARGTPAPRCGARDRPGAGRAAR